MHRSIVPVILALCALCACSPRPRPPRRLRRSLAAPAPPPPAKKATMICRNSQTGAKAVCGTRNAVMVGIKTD